MTLVILLLVLIIERVALQTTVWEVSTYLKHYLEFALPKLKTAKNNHVSLFIFVTAPAFIVGLLLHFIGSGLLEFIAGILILAICIGNAEARKLYRQYLNALERDDKEAQFILQTKLAKNYPADVPEDSEPKYSEVNSEHDEQVESAKENKSQSETLGETLIWINFKYYAAPIFYFVLFGLPGVVLYVTLLYLAEYQTNEEQNNINKQQLLIWLEWLNWLPSRLVSLGFMIVGHFTNGLETWLKYAVNLSKSSKEMLCQVAMDSSTFNAEKQQDNAQHMVNLTKRNMILFLVFVAMLTLYGRIL